MESPDKQEVEVSMVTEDMVLCYLRGFERRRHTEDGIQNLFDANLISLPVDAEKVREDAIREAVEWLLGEGLSNHAKRLEVSLLPTKDRAERLVREYEADVPAIERSYGGFARWLIEREG